MIKLILFKGSTLAALGMAVVLLAPALANASTSGLHGGNWADQGDNFQTGVIYPTGITSTTTTTQAAVMADIIASDDASVGINLVRIGINPATISDNWSVFQAYVNELVADGMNVDLGFWTTSSSVGTITNESAWQSMWETVDGVYHANNSVYYEPINEPHGYASESALSSAVYQPFLGFVSKSQNHIIVDGENTADAVINVGGDPNLTGCLLGLHIYPTWGPKTNTESGWENYLASRIGSYASRTLMTEMGAPATSGLNYGASSSDVNVCFIRGICTEVRTLGMGFVYWPSHRADDGYRLFDCLGGDVTNPSLIKELEYGWNVATYKAAPVAPCAATTADGHVELFAIGATNNCLYTDYQLTPGGSWSGWVRMETTISFAEEAVPVVGTNSDGRLEVFIVGTDGYLYHIWQNTPGSSTSTNWSSVTKLTTSAFMRPTAHLGIGTWANGCLDVFAIGTGGNLMHINQLATGGWSSFTSLGGATFAQDTDIGVNNELDGREEVILIGTGGNLCQNYQTAANSTSWNGWVNLGNSLSPAAHTALGRNSDGRLEIFSIGTGGNACHAWENTANTPGSWAAMASLGGTWNTDAKVSVATDENGALEVFIVDTGGIMNHDYQVSGTTWSGWETLSGATFNPIVYQCAGTEASGALDIFAIGTGGNMCHTSETAPNSAAWYSWGNMGGTFH
ncbi:MAG TPA: cellulase family glycosylhydrolase [Candidatus Sulfotelmatobacter sp.]|jgi:hypothetical protein|nr:cellulase family glycosylhydrolase [Candidatus Sulfotelmatobacter sp.]